MLEEIFEKINEKNALKLHMERIKKKLESFAKFYYKLPNISADSKWQNMRRSQFLI